MKNIAKMSERTYQNHSKYYSDYDLKFAISKLFDNIIDRYFLCEKKTLFNVHNVCTGGINIIYFLLSHLLSCFGILRCISSRCVEKTSKSSRQDSYVSFAFDKESRLAYNKKPDRF